MYKDSCYTYNRFEFYVQISVQSLLPSLSGLLELYPGIPGIVLAERGRDMAQVHAVTGKGERGVMYWGRTCAP